MREIFLLLIASLLLASPAPAADGATLYAQNCAACHGDRGSGGIGVPLALASAHGLVSDDYLRKTIRSGRPGRVMPAFTALADAEVEAVVRYVQTWGPAQAPRYAATPIGGNIANGRRLFAAHCANCHGASGEGGKGTGVTLSRPRDLPIMAPALHNPGFLASANDQMIKAILVKGIKGTPMVSFLERGLSVADINDVVAFVRGFEREPLPDSATVLASEEPSIVVDSPHDLTTMWRGSKWRWRATTSSSSASRRSTTAWCPRDSRTRAGTSSTSATSACSAKRCAPTRGSGCSCPAASRWSSRAARCA